MGARLSVPDPDTTDPEQQPPTLTSGLEALPSDLLAEIFLRVSPADLARASTACSFFRRFIADQAFLRRYRSIHPPLLLGFVSSLDFHPAEAPHPSAAVARAVALSFDYLPRTTIGHNWAARDACDSRVLLGCRVWFWEAPDLNLIVCNPMSKQYMLLPPITDDLLASIGIQIKDILHSGASFIRSGGTEEDTSFSVISWMQSKSRSRLGIFILSSVSGCWSVSTSISWGDLGLAQINQYAVLDRHISGPCTDGCFYWKLYCMSTLIKLDMNTMQFCTIGLPPGHEKRPIVIVESGESGIAMFSMISGGTSVDYYTYSQNGSGKSHEWHWKSVVPLPGHYTCKGITGSPHEGYIFIECFPDESNTTHSTFFSLEIKSFNIERVGWTGSAANAAYPYFGFLPSMLTRRI